MEKRIGKGFTFLYQRLQNRYNKEIVPKLKMIDQEEADGIVRDFYGQTQ